MRKAGKWLTATPIRAELLLEHWPARRWVIWFGTTARSYGAAMIRC